MKEHCSLSGLGQETCSAATARTVEAFELFGHSKSLFLLSVMHLRGIQWAGDIS